MYKYVANERTEAYLLSIRVASRSIRAINKLLAHTQRQTYAQTVACSLPKVLVSLFRYAATSHRLKRIKKDLIRTIKIDCNGIRLFDSTRLEFAIPNQTEPDWRTYFSHSFIVIITKRLVGIRFLSPSFLSINVAE